MSAGRPLRPVLEWTTPHAGPAPLEAAARAEREAIAVATFEACHCRDYARVDIRLDAGGRPHVLEINPMAWERHLCDREDPALIRAPLPPAQAQAPGRVYSFDVERARTASRAPSLTPSPESPNGVSSVR